MGKAVEPARFELITGDTANSYLVMDTYGAARQIAWARCDTAKRAAIVCALLNTWEVIDDGERSSVQQPLACPACGGFESVVLDSRKNADGLIRRRRCSACHARYKTREVMIGLTTPGEPV